MNTLKCLKCNTYLLYLVLLCLNVCSVLSAKIAIIGAGPGGLAALKYGLEDGHECDVFEQTGSIGGSWVYTNRTDFDENGLPVHSAMYEDLSTNVPKEIMTFFNFSYPEQNKSYISQPEVLSYLNNFTDYFNLREHIQLYKYVSKVQPSEGKKWTVTVIDAKTKQPDIKVYDAVLICNGHYRDVNIPRIRNQKFFRGIQFHSHKYRSPNIFANKSVLVIGGGPSGVDISDKISKVAKNVFISYRKSLAMLHKPENVFEKPELVKFYKNGAVFADGTVETFDIVLYCTGYKYSYPFLGRDSHITVMDNYVHPLYKHIVNVDHPTMFFLGIPSNVVSIPMLDLQARFALAAIENKFALPSKDDMLKELENAKLERLELGIPQRYSHQLRDFEHQKNYYEELANLAGINGIPLVLVKIQQDVKLNLRDKRFGYKIVDDENFERYVAV